MLHALGLRKVVCPVDAGKLTPELRASQYFL